MTPPTKAEVISVYQTMRDLERFTWPEITAGTGLSVATLAACLVVLREVHRHVFVFNADGSVQFPGVKWR